MTRFYLTLIFVASLFNTSLAQTNSSKEKYLKDSLATITKRVEKSIIKGRYMEGKLISTTETLKNWEGVKVKLYEYKESPKSPLARVYLAEANANKIASWIITSCVEATGKLDYVKTSLLIHKINEASNGQFPVLGVVVENNYPYIFKDGVTISLYKKVKNFLDPDLIKEENIKETKSFGRIISTTRKQFNILFPNIDTSGHKWRDIVREEYKKALNSNSNNLILAWAKTNLK